MKRVEKFEWNEFTFYPDHTKVDGKEFYADKTVYPNGKVQKLVNKKKMRPEILTDGRYYIVPNYKDKKHPVIDSKIDDIVGYYEPKRGVVEIWTPNGTSRRFPLWLADTIDDVLKMSPAECAKLVIGTNEITENAYMYRFPTDKTIEVYTNFKMKNGVSYIGYTKYYITRKYWIVRPYKNGKVVFKDKIIIIKKWPNYIYVPTDKAINLIYAPKFDLNGDLWRQTHNSKTVTIDPGKEEAWTYKTNRFGFPAHVTVNIDNYVRFKPRFNR